jgi:hypothetical protein
VTKKLLMFQLQKSLQREICDFSMWPCHLQRDGVCKECRTNSIIFKTKEEVNK